MVVIKQRGTGSVRLKSTTNSGEDTSLGLSGWSIKDKFYFKSGSTWMIKSGSNEALRIVVDGYEVAAATVTDATLSALSVSGATLSPAFDAATTTYSTTVANAVSQVTITETKSESTATVEYLDGSDATRTDADTMTAGLQVNLSVGTNTVKVKVTAPDTTTEETYTVNILRVAVPVACSAASMTGRVWTGNLTVGSSGSVGSSATGYAHDPGNPASDYGSLSDNQFGLAGISYTIRSLAINVVQAISLDDLQLRMRPALGDQASHLTLHLGSDSFALAAATNPQATTFAWSNHGLSWANGDSVCLALTEEVASVASTDATLSALALSGVTLSPAFDADTETYTASVANSVATTTVTAMATDAGATVAVTPSTDADAVTSGHQVNLGVGPTTITATVTAEDGMTTKTYTVVVTRAQTCTVPIGGIWGACLTAATISSGSTFDASLPLTGLGCLTTSCGDTSVLTSRDFSFGGKNYRIEAVDLRGGTLEFNLVTPNANTAAAEFSSVVLHVGTLSYSLASASFVGNSEAFAWTNTGLSWSANDKVALQLVELASTDPDVSSVEITSAPTTYAIGDSVEATVNFSAAVDITGTPQLELDFAGTPKPAACMADTGTEATLCSYTVVMGDSAPNGIAIAANKLTLNGGTITATGSTTITADLDHGAVAIAANHKVDGIRPTLVTTGSEAPTTSTDGTKIILFFNEFIGTVDRTKITVKSGTTTQATPLGSVLSGPRLEIALATALTSADTAVTVELGTDAVTDGAGNGNLAVAATAVTNALGAPDVPHSLDATPGNRQVMLSWVLPSGGSEVTDYEYEQDGSGTWISTGGTATDYTVRNLTNGQPYTFRVRAVNSAGASAASAASPSVTPATEPDAPTGLGATVSDRRVDLMWTAPASDGGQSITDYEYEQGGSGTWISTGSTATSYTIRNLTNGQPYRFRVRAVNSVGAGAASAASPNVTPATEPDAPTGLSATVSDQRVDLIWRAPASNGGAPILRYEYELDFSGTWTSTGGTASSYTVTGLTNGQFYTFRVRAVNRVGAGLASSSQSATPTSTVVAPDAPFGLSATPGNRQVMLSWVQPSGGAALTHYEYDQDGSGTWTSTGGTASSYTVTGLTNGQSYTFRVRAVNSAGQSAASGSRTATPTTTAPEAPESLRFTPGDQQVTLRWRAPTNDGGEPITHYEYEQDRSGAWISTGGTATSHTVTGLNNGQTYTFRVRAVNALGNGAVVMLEATPSPSTGRGGGGGGGGPQETWPSAPRNLLAEGGDGQVKLTWEAPASDGGAAITDYEYRIDRRNPWTAIGSTDTTHTVTGLVNGTVYVFEVRAVNRIGRGRASNRAEATPEAPEVFTQDFAHFANGTGITSEMVLVNVSSHPIRPAIYFYDRGGHLIDPESVVDVTVDLEVTEDGGLTVRTEMEPLGELTISTHGQGELVSGSVKVLSDGPIGGGVRYGVPNIGVAGVGASPPVRDVLFPARRQEGGIRTATALHNLGAEAMGVSCRLMNAGVSLEEVEIPLEANGQTSWFIEEAFPTTDTSDFLGSVRCTAPGRGRFTAIAVEMDAAQRIFNTLSVVPVDRTGGGGGETVLDFAHFVNGTWITDLVFLNLSTEASRPAPTPFHTDILPSRPAIYFYDTEGNPIAAASVVDITGDLEITEDGALTVRTEMEPLGVLTISTHGRGALVSGSVRVVSEGPIGGMLRFEHPDLGVAGVGASPPLSDALFPVRRQEGGINTGVALHNLESSAGLVHCDLMREGVLLDGASIPLEANGQASWLIDQAFPDTDTSDFAGSVRCSAVGGDLFTAVALEMDHGTRIFTTLPVVPVPERMSQE